MQNRKTIFSLRTVSWFQNEKLHSHAYASFITILVRLGMRNEKKNMDGFFFHDRSQVCFIELKTNKSMIRQVMQYFMRTFHSTALPFISFGFVFLLQVLLLVFFTFFAHSNFVQLWFRYHKREMSWTNWNMIFVASFVGGKWRFKSLIKFVQCNKRIEIFWGESVEKSLEKSLEKIKINWKNVKKRRN